MNAPQITLEQLRTIMPNVKALRASIFLAPLNATFIEFDINSPARVAAFLAQVAHESGELTYVKELASGEAYEGRKDLGNLSPGDGKKFKGRGLIQITGRANYFGLGEALGQDFITHPEAVEETSNATRSAGWFWQTHHLNVFADADDFVTLTKRINGGTNGLADREAHLERAKKALGMV